MTKFLWSGMLILGLFWGAVYKNNFGVYQADYNKVVINVPVAFRSSLKDKHYALGEKYLGENLQDEMRRQGKNVRMFTFEDSFLNRDYHAGYQIFLRSIPELNLEDYHNFVGKDKISVLYETIPYELKVVKNADIVFTGSLKKVDEYKKLGLEAHFVPQFTNAHRFYYAPKENYRVPILYIANQWPKFPTRKTIVYAQKYNIPLTVYGSDWWDILKGKYAAWWQGLQIPNEDLKYYYSSADIVLNDTRQDMIDVGFISNRIFDVTACRGFIISDYIKEIEDIYGDAIPMYKNEAEFAHLIAYYLAHPDERRKKAEQAHKITMENFTAEQTVRKMIKIMNDYKAKRGL